MKKLLVAFLLLCAVAQAQVTSITTYVNNQLPIQQNKAIGPQNVRNAVLSVVNNFSSIPYTGQISTAFPISTTSYVTASTYYGDGSHLSGIAASGVSGSTVIDVRNAPYNVICDGLPHSGNLTGAQAALDLARTQSGTTVILAPANVTCVYGTNTTVNLENPLKYVSNTNIAFYGTALHNINNGDLFLLEGLNNALSCTQYQQNVNIVGYAGSSVDTVSRTLSQSRKLIGVTCTKNYMLAGMYSSTTTNIGSFGYQLRNVEDGLVINNTVKLVPVFPAASGGDAFHIHGNVSGTNLVIGNTFWGDDDGCSVTLETVNMNGMTQKGINFTGNDCRSYRNSAMKMGIETSTINATIFGTIWEGNHFALTGPVGAGSDGNCFKIDMIGSSTRGQISDTIISNNVFDCPNGEAFGAQTTGAGPFGSVAGTSQQPQGIYNTLFKNNVYSGYQYRGIELGQGADVVTFDGGVATNYSGQREIVSPSLITSMTYSTANVIRIDFTPGVVSTGSVNIISPSAQYYVSITTGANVSNTGRFYITQVSNDFVLATASNISTTSDQTGVSISGSIIFRPGTFFYHRGAKNVTIRNMRADDPPQFTNLTTESGVIPENPVYENNQVSRFWDLIAYQDSASLNARFFNNQCVGSHGDKCMTEAASTSISNSTFIMNRDAGTNSVSRLGFSLSDTEFREKWGNYAPTGTATSSTVVACPTGGLSLTPTCPAIN